MFVEKTLVLRNRGILSIPTHVLSLFLSFPFLLMADPSRIFALGATTQAQGLTWRDFEGDFSETTFMDQVTAPAMLKGRIFKILPYSIIEITPDWDGRIDVKRLRNVLDTARSQVISVQGTVKGMIQEQATKCKQAGMN